MNKSKTLNLRAAIIFLICVNCSASELLSVQELLDTMERAQSSLNYQGTFVFKHGDKLDAMRITHGVIDGEVKQRIVSLNDIAREVIRDGDSVKCIWPRKRMVVVVPTVSFNGMPSIVPKDLSNVSAAYKIESSRQSQIAGQSCQLITMLPTDKYRYGYEFCVQPSNGILLRSKVIDMSRQKVLEEMLFTQIDILDSLPAPRFESKYDLSQFSWRSSLGGGIKSRNDDLSSDHFKISKLPPNFVLKNTSQFTIETNSRPVHHMVLSDSIASISIFISESGSQDRLVSKLTGRGAINAFTKSDDRYKITVLGEVPSETVELIGASVRFYE